MKSKNILVTGCAGFVGMHLCKSLLEDGHVVLGIDNINDYYSPLLKIARLNELKKYNNFNFTKFDIADKISLINSFQSFNPEKVVNLAAQVGVRYSIENPHIYMDSNIIGFLNILECCKEFSVESLFYASSSSVYGGNEKIPFDISDSVDDPISVYAASKKTNELMANVYSHLYGLRTTGLRFFTVYGPWGRPDMAVFKFTEYISKNKAIEVYNHGDMRRDFTYIDDIISGVRSAIEKNYKCEIFNLGNRKSEKLLDLIYIIEQDLGLKARIKFKSMQPGDMKETCADITHSTNRLDYIPKTDIQSGIKKFTDWYKLWSGEN